MKIDKIEICNLASIEGEQSIDFTQEPLKSAGLFAITGNTGTGKSTILDAICLALYNEAPRLANKETLAKSGDDGTPKAVFQHANGQFQAQWKPNEMQQGLDSEGRLVDKQIAEAKLKFFGQEPLTGVISGYSKAKKQEAQRLPFSLSTLQVLAGLWRTRR